MNPWGSESGGGARVTAKLPLRPDKLAGGAETPAPDPRDLASRVNQFAGYPRRGTLSFLSPTPASFPWRVKEFGRGAGTLHG